MTTIRDPHDPLRGVQLLAQRWDETKPADTRPMHAGVLVDWRAPTFVQRLRNAWWAAMRELAR